MNVPMMCLQLSLVLTASCVQANVQLRISSKTPRTSESLQFTCFTTGTELLTWLKDGKFTSACSIQSPVCYPPTLFPYSFTSYVDSKTSVLRITSVSMDSCGKFTCSDLSGNQDSVVVNVIKFDSEGPLETTEPGQESSGTITVTTDCIFPNFVTIKWIIVQNGTDIGVIDNYTYSVETCSAKCTGTPAVKIRTALFHNETEMRSITVSYKVVIKHRDIFKPVTWISPQIYNVEDRTRQTSVGSVDTSSNFWIFATVFGFQMIAGEMWI